MALYGGPYLVINAWLVLYTWLQHTDTDVPHFTDDDHNFVKGAMHTIDRPYDKLDPFGAIDFLHHKIGSTHVAHHYDSSIPHYKAQAATDAIKENFSEVSPLVTLVVSIMLICSTISSHQPTFTLIIAVFI